MQEGMPIVTIIARQIRRQLGSGVQSDELQSFGLEGLLMAARNFDPTLGVPFVRFANYRIRGAMLDGVRSNSMLPRSVYQRLRAAEAGHHAAESAAEEDSAKRAALPPKKPMPASADTSRESRPPSRWVSCRRRSLPGSEESVDRSLPADEVIAQGETLAAVREAIATLPEPGAASRSAALLRQRPPRRSRA